MAIMVYQASDGYIFPPDKLEDRIVTPISELRKRGIEVEFGSPHYDFVRKGPGVPNIVYMLGGYVFCSKTINGGIACHASRKFCRSRGSFCFYT